MSFKARCEFCQLEIQAPDHALGMSVRCPRCENQFTVAPVEQAFPLPRWRGKKAVASSKSTNAQVALAEERAKTEEAASQERIPHVVPAAAVEGSTAEPAPSWRRHLNPAGVLALLLGGLGLMFASLAGWTWLTIPLAALGILVGSAGILWAHVSDSPGKPVAVGGAVVSTAIFGVALLFPAWLGPVYQTPSARGQSASAIEVIPLQLTEETLALDEAGYADASRAALQQAGLRMHVVSVSVGSLTSATKKKAASERYLLVRLRVQRVQDGQEFAKGAAAFDNAAEPQLKLTDQAGKLYRQRALESVVPKENEPRPSPFPVAVIDEVFAFEPVPSRGVSLRLEVPTAGWGGSGVFRFTIPEAMIRREPAGAGSLGGSPGRP